MAITYKKPEGLTDNDFWRINPRKNQKHTIEWTGKEGGWVRGKITDMANFIYMRCPHYRFAETDGWILIDKQRSGRLDW